MRGTKRRGTVKESVSYKDNNERIGLQIDVVETCNWEMNGDLSLKRIHSSPTHEAEDGNPRSECALVAV
jgi:hypothetical protein